MKRVKRTRKPSLRDRVFEAANADDHEALSRLIEANRSRAGELAAALRHAAMVALAEKRVRTARVCVEVFDDPATRMLRAELSVTEGDDAGAERTIREVLQVAPDNPSAYERLASILARRGELKAALEENAGALALDERRTTAWFQRGSLLDGAGRSDEALDAFRSAIRGEGSRSARLDALRALVARLGGEAHEEERTAALRLIAELE